jgi:hypothetical protein
MNIQGSIQRGSGNWKFLSYSSKTFLWEGIQNALVETAARLGPRDAVRLRSYARGKRRRSPRVSL